ncbi:hypothetical protein JIR001_23400 [Polycladomyces abyssicola]|uniref:Uncharacterized protein n=1 Tax=Polycladomyces abyssicola TaxID=1125966 RepID=A0A8D5UFR6_9BACL|nr:hypothetical protein JIR001_23400 [Polycladomyces abyssicola]
MTGVKPFPASETGKRMGIQIMRDQMNQYTPAESAGAIYHRCPMNVIKFFVPTDP